MIRYCELVEDNIDAFEFSYGNWDTFYLKDGGSGVSKKINFLSMTLARGLHLFQHEIFMMLF